jgi:3-oxoacyl-ACP reductase-like protein
MTETVLTRECKMRDEEFQFYKYIEDKVAKNPHWVVIAISAATSGNAIAFESASKACADWETIAALTTSKSVLKGNEAFLASKIRGIDENHMRNNPNFWDEVADKLLPKKEAQNA